jgi:hypothetical protein
LYKTDPEDEAIQNAATKARNQYLQAHPDVAHSNIVIGPKSTLHKLGNYRSLDK